MFADPLSPLNDLLVVLVDVLVREEAEAEERFGKASAAMLPLALAEAIADGPIFFCCCGAVIPRS